MGRDQSGEIRVKKGGDRSEAVIGYIRVSTDQQAESGAGMAARRATIHSQCKHNGWELAAIYEDDGASAKALSGRPGLSQALHALANGDAAALVVAKLDRLARSVHDFAGLVRGAEPRGVGHRGTRPWSRHDHADRGTACQRDGVGR